MLEKYDLDTFGLEKNISPFGEEKVNKPDIETLKEKEIVIRKQETSLNSVNLIDDVIRNNVKSSSICQNKESYLRNLHEFELSRPQSVQNDFLSGIKENIIGLWEYSLNSKIGRRTLLKALPFELLAIMTACVSKSTEINANYDKTSIAFSQAIPTETATINSEPTANDAPLFSVESAPYIHLNLTLEDVKNITPSPEVGIDTSGNLTNLPEGLSSEIKADMKGYYDAILEKYPDSKIYYSREETDNAEDKLWIFYAITPEGKLVHWVTSYGGGALQYADYPLNFEISGDKLNVIGEYEEIDIPGEVLGVIWKNHYPQFLAGEKVIGKDSIFTEFFNYLTYAGDSPWTEVSGINDILPVSPEFTTLESLGTIQDHLTSEQIAKLEIILKNGIGTWDENRVYDSKDLFWEIRIISSGELLDFQESPLVIPISDNEKMKVFVAVRGYYLDVDGLAQEIISPLVAQLPDGRMFFFGVGSNYFSDWTTNDDLSEKVIENGEKNDFKIWEKGTNIKVFILSDAQAFLVRAFGSEEAVLREYDSNGSAYIGQWISKFNSVNSEKVQKFLSTGRGLSFVIPWQQVIRKADNLNLNSIDF